jgi:hypothetical protein
VASFQLQHVLSEIGHTHMAKALETLPADRIEAYKQVMTRITKPGSHTTVTVTRALTWLFHAARPLRMEELCEALTFEECSTDIGGEMKFFPAQIIAMCQSLVIHEESSGIVRFVHPTVHEFLKSYNLPVINLATTCLAYLENEAFDDIVTNRDSMELRMQKYKLCLYSARFWDSHVRGEAETFPSIRETFFRIWEMANKRNSILQMTNYAISNWDWLHITAGQTLLHIIASNGFSNFCKFFLDGESKDGFIGCLFETNCEETTEVVLKSMVPIAKTMLCQQNRCYWTDSSELGSREWTPRSGEGVAGCQSGCEYEG